IAHIDPATQSIGILHIPRDLFFALPPTSDGTPLPLVRVNTLLLRGESIDPGNGVYYLMDTLGYNLGIYIDGYVLFDFEAFVTLIDALGGVDITTTYNIYDPTYPDMNYGYDPFYLPSGTHTLDGATALQFARTRHGDNDYVRGARQLQLLRAIGQRATEPLVLPQLLLQAPDLLAALEGKLYTDLTLTDSVNLLSFAAGIPIEAILTASLNEAYITYTVNEGDSVAIPDRELLPELLTTVFGANYSD
ncbi:MAG: LCP family protein, partial [Armatimonadetes bacterium]|nr:LCP family protein [Anaerolineae bacterium]